MKTYRLPEGVNRVRVGSIVVDEHGYTAADAHEERLLDSHADLLATPKASKPKASTEEPTA